MNIHVTDPAVMAPVPSVDPGLALSPEMETASETEAAQDPAIIPAAAPQAGSWEHILAAMEQERIERLAQWVETRASLLNELRLLGVTEVEGAYDGYGDSGEVTSISAFNGETEVNLTEDMQGKLEDFTWHTAYGNHPGFENNDGAYGTLGWDVTEDAITLEHNARFTDVNCSVSEL